MEKMIEIPEWQLKKIENTFRLVSNAMHSTRKETCLDRDICQHHDWIKNVLTKE
jgi:hypothetical protein